MSQARCLLTLLSLTSLCVACSSGQITLEQETADIPTAEVECIDMDGDQITTAEGDCDDLRADVFPGAIERRDLVDNDCDGLIDEFKRDATTPSCGQSERWIVSCVVKDGECAPPRLRALTSLPIGGAMKSSAPPALPLPSRPCWIRRPPLRVWVYVHTTTTRLTCHDYDLFLGELPTQRRL